MGKANLPYFGRAVGKANLGRKLSGQGKFALFRLGRNLSGQGKFALFWNLSGQGKFALCRLGRNLSGQGKFALFWVGRAGTLVGKATLPYFGRAVGKANWGWNLSGQGKFALFRLGRNLSGQGKCPCFGSAGPEP